MSEIFAKNMILNGLASTDQETGYQFFGIFSRNSVEWLVTDIACQLMSVTTVTFYATLGELAFQHIVNQTVLSTIAISPDSISAFLKYKNKYGLESVKNIVLLDLTQAVKESSVKELENLGLNVYLFSKLAKDTPQAKVEFNISKPDTTLTLCYTSGTTGLPKGAELSQRNFAADIVCPIDCGYTFTSHTVHLSYLPLAHVFERMAV